MQWSLARSSAEVISWNSMVGVQGSRHFQLLKDEQIQVVKDFIRKMITDADLVSKFIFYFFRISIIILRYKSYY